MHKATVEQAAAAKKAEEAARLREEQQQQQQDKEQEVRDVDMEAETTNQDDDAAAAPATATVVDESVPETEKVAGKKRLATPEEDEEAGANRDGDRQGWTDDVDEQASDNESRSSEQGVAVNETKRLRVR